MPIVRFPAHKRSLRLAGERGRALHGERLARAIERLEDPQRRLVVDIVARLDPTPELPPCPPERPEHNGDHETDTKNR
jgi:hypothetical protein